MKLWRRLSIKSKLFFLLISLPALTLGLYISLAVMLFQDDKLAYVFDSSASIARGLAADVSVELLLAQAAIRPLVEGYSPQSRDFDAAARKYFESEEKVLGFQLLESGAGGAASSNPASPVPTLIKGEFFQPADLARLHVTTAAWAKDPDLEGVHFSAWKATSKFHDYAAIGVSTRAAGDPRRFLAVVVVAADRIADVFGVTGAFQSFLIDRTGVVLLGPPDPKAAFLAMLPLLRGSPSVAAAREFSAPDGTRALASFSRVASSGLSVVSLIERQAALGAVEILLIKSLLVFVVLLALTVLLSVFAARALTSAIAQLHSATGLVAQGNFDVHVTVRAEDEVGDLAKSFNEMAKRISVLLAENAEKVRMEMELKTARLVQKTLFPEHSVRFGPLEISGSYEPASECGGDWWHYGEIQGKIYLWIGDVMGHGMSSALMTSAARAFAAVIESLGRDPTRMISPSQVLELLNQAIFQTSKGQTSMTFFLGSFDPATGELLYANASHAPPYVFPQGDSSRMKAPVSAPGEVLGIHPVVHYKENRLALMPGDLLIFYTDGVFDALGPEEQRLGRKKMKLIFREAVSGGGSAMRVRDSILKAVTGFQQGVPPDDDITVLVCKVVLP